MKDPISVQLLNAILREPGIRRSALLSRFGDDADADAITAAIDYLKRTGLVYTDESLASPHSVRVPTR